MLTDFMEEKGEIYLTLPSIPSRRGRGRSFSRRFLPHPILLPGGRGEENLRLLKKVQMLLRRGAGRESYSSCTSQRRVTKTTPQMGLFQQPATSRPPRSAHSSSLRAARRPSLRPPLSRPRRRSMNLYGTE